MRIVPAIWTWIKLELAALLAIFVVVVFGLLFLGSNVRGLKSLENLGEKIDALSDRMHDDISKATTTIGATVKAEGIETRNMETSVRDEVKGIHEQISNLHDGLEEASRDSLRRLEALEQSNAGIREAIESNTRAKAAAPIIVSAPPPAPPPTPASIPSPVQTTAPKETSSHVTQSEESKSDESRFGEQDDRRAEDERPEHSHGGTAIAGSLRPTHQTVQAGDWVTGLSEKDIRQIGWISNRDAVIARIYYRHGLFRKFIDMPLPIRAFPRDTESIDLFAKEDITITW